MQGLIEMTERVVTARGTCRKCAIESCDEHGKTYATAGSPTVAMVEVDGTDLDDMDVILARDPVELLQCVRRYVVHGMPCYESWGATYRCILDAQYRVLGFL